MQPYVTGTALALVTLPVIIALLLSASASLARHHPPQGWRALKPSAGQWFGAIGSAAFSALIISVWVFVGSSRSDGAFQMNIAWWLALAFGLGACIAAWQMLSIALGKVSWRGNQIASGQSRRDLGDIDRVEHSWLRRTRLVFNDGYVIPVDLQASGANELLQRIYKLKGMEDYIDPPEH